MKNIYITIILFGALWTQTRTTEMNNQTIKATIMAPAQLQSVTTAKLTNGKTMPEAIDTFIGTYMPHTTDKPKTELHILVNQTYQTGYQAGLMAGKLTVAKAVGRALTPLMTDLADASKTMQATIDQK